MHDLNIIERKNREAIERDADAQRAAGKWVVATYTGVAVVSTEAFATQAEAEAAFGAERSSPDVHRKLLPPTRVDAAVQGVTLTATAKGISPAEQAEESTRG